MSLLSTDSPLCPGFNALVLEIAFEMMPQGWDAIPDAPDTLEDLKAYYQEHGRVAVNSNNLYGFAVGEPIAYWAFRAWHDLLHVTHDTETRFTMPGERAMAELHHREFIYRLGDTERADYYADLVRVEVDAANDLYVKTGEWPTDLRPFAIGWLQGRGWSPEKIKAFSGDTPPHERPLTNRHTALTGRRADYVILDDLAIDSVGG